MGKVCVKCGTENREKAMFCKGCGGKLVTGQSPASVEGPSLRCPECSTFNSSDSRFCKSCGCSLLPAPPPPAVPLVVDAIGTDVHPVFEPVARSKGMGSRKLSLMGMLLAAIALSAWFYVQQLRNPSHPSSPAAATLAAESALPAAHPPMATVPEVKEPTVSAPASETATSAAPTEVDPVAQAAEAERVNALNAHNARLNQQRLDRERLERERRERILATQQQARAAQELEQERAEQARRPAQSAPAQPAGAVSAPIKPVAQALTVARICDEAGNFFAREVCRVRECLKASQANDPICVNFRKMEEANRAREPYN